MSTFSRTHHYGEVVLEQRLRDALALLNPGLPDTSLDDAFRKLTRPEGSTLESRNRAFHRMLVDGVTVEYRTDDGAIRGAQARVIDFDDPAGNDWLAVNQFTVTENSPAATDAAQAGRNTRRPDVVLFVNGLPLGVIELKNPADEDATVWTAWRQIQTYKAELPTLFSMNAMLMVSDGVEARVGTLTAGREWFKPWRTVSGETLADSQMPQLQVMLLGTCEQPRFLALLRDFIVFEDDGSGALLKKMAGYHQFHAVQVAVVETLRAAKLQRAKARIAQEGDGRYESGRKPGGAIGDRRIGVVWHTQGSGKSLTMAFYAGSIIREPAMENPTIVVLTDRNDLDDQLFGTFSRCQELLRQPPVQAESRADLRSKLSVNAGGVVFTTIQKFMPPAAAPSPQPSPSVRGGQEGAEALSQTSASRRGGQEGAAHLPQASLSGRREQEMAAAVPSMVEEKGDRHPSLSERRNIVVIADEAHRSQYDFIDGFAGHMRDALPNASFIGFTGPRDRVEGCQHSRRLRRVHQRLRHPRSVEDKATVPIYYESRLAKLALDEEEKPKIDPEFEEATEGEEVERRERLKTKWAQLEAVVGAENRLKLVAEDVVAHFEQRLETLDGKAMVVCMSRRICIDLYRELARLRPDWRHEDDGKGNLKVVMTGSASDPQTGSGTSATSPGAKAWPSGSATPATPSKSFSCATCGSPASTRPASTPCTWTSRCAAMG